MKWPGAEAELLKRIYRGSRRWSWCSTRERRDAGVVREIKDNQAIVSSDSTLRRSSLGCGRTCASSWSRWGGRAEPR